jgi:hypothetical protein
MLISTRGITSQSWVIGTVFVCIGAAPQRNVEVDGSQLSRLVTMEATFIWAPGEIEDGSIYTIRQDGPQNLSWRYNENKNPRFLSLSQRAEPLLRSRQLCSYSRTSQHFTGPEGSQPCSQEPSTGLYPEPDQSNSYHPILSPPIPIGNWTPFDRPVTSLSSLKWAYPQFWLSSDANYHCCHTCASLNVMIHNVIHQ